MNSKPGIANERAGLWNPAGKVVGCVGVGNNLLGDEIAEVGWEWVVKDLGIMIRSLLFRGKKRRNWERLLKIDTFTQWLCWQRDGLNSGKWWQGDSLVIYISESLSSWKIGQEDLVWGWLGIFSKKRNNTELLNTAYQQWTNKAA